MDKQEINRIITALESIAMSLLCMENMLHQAAEQGDEEKRIYPKDMN